MPPPKKITKEKDYNDHATTFTSTVSNKDVYNQMLIGNLRMITKTASKVH